ncbi:caspase-9 isoform X1 [Conger conger]|uniref:caspase-9 isoform X1 n=2 Tax=Conger conger TaxID=82655 RepID=UPI002A5A5697|nr:caspase-9 isoform X1 [Conger conger]
MSQTDETCREIRMDPRDRRILLSNRSNLVSKLDPSVLYDGLLSRGIFNQDMIDEIQIAGTRRDQARRLVQDLEMRGSRAFPAFLECLLETGQGHIVQFLQNGDSPSPPVPPPVRPNVLPVPLVEPFLTDNTKGGNKPDKCDFTPLPDVTKPDPLPSPYPDISPRPRPRSDSIQNYKMDANPCGLCLIINNVDFETESKLSSRKGSDVDCDRLERRFKSLNFVVTVKKNLKQRQIKQELSRLSKEDHSKYDCCVVIILSHGTEASHSRFPGAVHGVDGPSVPIQNITNYLNGQHCPTLQSKPKLFFIQACGGGEKDTGFEVSPEEVTPQEGGVDDQTDALPVSSSSDSLSCSDEVDARATLPTPSDILVSYSTFPGYVSWRDTMTGSWYVETMDRVLEENAATNDLVTMLTLVNSEVSQISAKGLYKQMPGSFNFLRKRFFFQTPPQ